MPSPYGSRSASTYYQHPGVPRRYVADWTGMPFPGARAAESRALGAEGDYLDIIATARFHKELGDYPVSMSMESGRRSILHSGPEKSLGALSHNEKRLLLIGGAGLALFFAYKHFIKGKR